MANRFSDHFLDEADPQSLMNYVRRLKLQQEQQNLSFVDINLFDILPGVITNIIIQGGTANVHDDWKNVFVFDDFLSGISLFVEPSSSALYLIGNLNWMAPPDGLFVASAISAGLAPDHPGLIKISTQAQDDGVFGYMVLSTAWVLPNKFDLMQFVGLCEGPIEAGDGIIYGAVSCAVDSGFNVDRTAEGIYFSFIYGETNWQAVTRDASTSTVTDTGVAFDDSKWFLFEIKRTATDTFKFYINQILVATHTTNITANPVTPTVGMSCQTIESYGIYIDYFGMSFTPITQRWD